MGRRLRRFRHFLQEVVKITRRVFSICHCGQIREELEEEIVPVASVLNGSVTNPTHRTSVRRIYVSYIGQRSPTVLEGRRADRRVCGHFSENVATRNTISAPQARLIQVAAIQSNLSRPMVQEFGLGAEQGRLPRPAVNTEGHQGSDHSNQTILRYSVSERWSQILPTQVQVRDQIKQDPYGAVELVTSADGNSSTFIRKRATGRLGREEAILTMICQCDFVVRLLACFTSADDTYLYMPYYPMKDLNYWLELDVRRQVFNEEMATWIMTHLLVAVFHIHSLGYLHMDIKPSNIFIDNNGFPVLGDFGAALKATRGARAHTVTRDYACPELLLTGYADKMMDLWACAVTFYEIVTHKVPHLLMVNVMRRAPTRCRRVLFSVKSFSPTAADYVSTQLRLRKQQRLGFRLGIVEVMKHRIFAGFGWSAPGEITFGNKSRMYDKLLELQQQPDQ